jgi:hypothetical protein
LIKEYNHRGHREHRERQKQFKMKNKITDKFILFVICSCFYSVSSVFSVVNFSNECALRARGSKHLKFGAGDNMVSEFDVRTDRELLHAKPADSTHHELIVIMLRHQE